MKPRKAFDCVEMKRKIQEKIHEETKDLSREELIDYFHRHADGALCSSVEETRQECPFCDGDKANEILTGRIAVTVTRSPGDIILISTWT